MRELERYIVLQVVDNHWKEQLHAMDVLRQGIGLRGYGQRNPLQEYAFEAFNLFEEMKGGIRLQVAKLLFRVQVETRQAATASAATAGTTGQLRKTRVQHRPRFGQQLAQHDLRRERGRGGVLEPLIRQHVGAARRASGSGKPVPAPAANPGSRAETRSRRRQSRPQRPLSLRQRQKVQALPWARGRGGFGRLDLRCTRRADLAVRPFLVPFWVRAIRSTVSSDLTLRTTFDRGRPNATGTLVPRRLKELVDAMLRHLQPGAHVLEVGCGTGQATLPLAQAGLRVYALELGPALAELARTNLSRYPNVTVRDPCVRGFPV